MKKFLIVMAIIFGILTIILYFSSINKLDYNTAKLMGTSATINIQATVFCAATAIMCVINIVGALIYQGLEFLTGNQVDIINTVKETAKHE